MSRKKQVCEVMGNLFEIAQRFQEKWGRELWIEYRNGMPPGEEDAFDTGHFQLFIAKSDVDANEIAVGLYCPPIAAAIADGRAESGFIYEPTSESLALLEQRLDGIMSAHEIARAQP